MPNEPRDANGIVWKVRDGDCLVCQLPLEVWQVPDGKHTECMVQPS